MLPTHPLLVVCLLGNSLLKFTPMIQRDLSFYYPDCNKEVCLVIASESLQCITQVIASYYSVSLIVSATSSAKTLWHRASGVQSSVEEKILLFMERFGPHAWRLWPFLNSLTCDAIGRQSIEHRTLGRCLLRRGKTPSIDCQATCRKQLRSSASKLLSPTR